MAEDTQTIPDPGQDPGNASTEANMARFIQTGARTNYTPTADVAAGDVVVQGDLIGVADRAIKANTLGALTHEGVYEFPKAAGAAIAAGVVVYWDAANSVITATAGSLKRLGKMAKAAASADTLGEVRLEQ